MDLQPPKTEKENLLWRAKLMFEAEERKDGRYTQRALEAQKYLTNICKENIIFFFNAFLWTYDPRPDRGKPDKPFVTYPKQNDYLRWLEKCYRSPHNVSGFVDKARDVGCSFTTIGWVLWHWLFDTGFNAVLGSRKEDKVFKKGDPDTLFFKLEYMTRTLPVWMLPPGFDLTKNHRFLMQDRPDSTNTITGESANPDFGRAGRQSVAILDEFGFWPWARASWEACGESAHFRLAVTTPPIHGTGSHAYKIKVQQVGKTEVFTFDYDSVPWKDSRWLQRAKEGKSDDEFNREIMRSYQGSTSNRVYAREWYQFVRRDEKLEYNPVLPLYVSWDYGRDGTAMIWWQKDFRTGRKLIVDAYWNKDHDIDFFIPFVTGTVGEGYKYEPWELKLINKHAEWKRPDAHYGDPDVKKRGMMGPLSLKDYMGLPPRFIHVQSRNWTKDLSPYVIRESCKLVFKQLTINPVTCSMLEWAMENARYPEPSEMNESTTPKDKPIHDDTSHLRTAFEYFVINDRDEEPTGAPEGVVIQSDENEDAQRDDLSFSSLA